jgi:hypothetical protein
VLRISFFVTGAATVDVAISRNKRIVGRLQGSALADAGWAHLGWNARNGSRKKVAPGRYSISAHAVGPDGSSAQASMTVIVKR